MNTPATMIATASPTRRSRRDWVVDTLLFLVAVVFGLLVIGGRLERGPTAGGWRLAAWLPWPA
jgi:hypothetical protein